MTEQERKIFFGNLFEAAKGLYFREYPKEEEMTEAIIKLRDNDPRKGWTLKFPIADGEELQNCMIFFNRPGVCAEHPPLVAWIRQEDHDAAIALCQREKEELKLQLSAAKRAREQLEVRLATIAISYPPSPEGRESISTHMAYTQLQQVIDENEELRRQLRHRAAKLREEI